MAGVFCLDNEAASIKNGNAKYLFSPSVLDFPKKIVKLTISKITYNENGEESPPEHIESITITGHNKIQVRKIMDSFEVQIFEIRKVDDPSDTENQSCIKKDTKTN